MNATAVVQAQYATEHHLELRRAAWMPGPDGREPSTEALDVLDRADPDRILEVGCGTGEFAARVALARPQSTLVAVDLSERFVELTGSRGIDAYQADVQSLPFDDDSFDAVAALWMLYHVPDLDLGLAEIRRVLRPGGTFVAVTNGDEHVADLRREAGGAAAITTFSSENGGAALERHFDHVTREDIATKALFPDHAATMAYLESMESETEWLLPEFEGPRQYDGHTTVFVGA